jgi:hypothetical protein
MSFSEVVQLLNAGGIIVCALVVYRELTLIRPILQAIVLFLANQATPETQKKVRALTPPMGTPTDPSA